MFRLALFIFLVTFSAQTLPANAQDRGNVTRIFGIGKDLTEDGMVIIKVIGRGYENQGQHSYKYEDTNIETNVWLWRAKVANTRNAYVRIEDKIIECFVLYEADDQLTADCFFRHRLAYRPGANLKPREFVSLNGTLLLVHAANDKCSESDLKNAPLERYGKQYLCTGENPNRIVLHSEGLY